MDPHRAGPSIGTVLTRQPMHRSSLLWDAPLAGEEHLKNPKWHPFKVVEVNGNPQEILDEDDEKLRNLKQEWGVQIYAAVACAIYGNWWPMLSALMYVLVPMPCLFFGGGSTQFLTSWDGGGWIDAAKFMTGASAVGSIAIPIILGHAHMIETGAMLIEFTSFFIFACTVMCFHRASLEEDW
ncbi:hypothetical protein CMV_016310 [Castanea mollissima]|uniref:Uncharacterized protein n=1 Tax=Castanea mollissima TaxID=60419 RepID=A0A8J4QU50_9ROSI|nr:hypothetical protein CMV_016310 [Castanea mollissima]